MPLARPFLTAAVALTVGTGLAGCGGPDDAAPPDPPPSLRQPVVLPFGPPVPPEPPYDAHAFRIRVVADGCGVVRSPGQDEGLTWTVDDHHGFEVMGASALGSRRFRAYRHGRYMVVLTAFHGDAYRSVSNAVDVVCR